MIDNDDAAKVDDRNCGNKFLYVHLFFFWGWPSLGKIGVLRVTHMEGPAIAIVALRRKVEEGSFEGVSV
jgi:hypothetical protein